MQQRHPSGLSLPLNVWFNLIANTFCWRLLALCFILFFLSCKSSCFLVSGASDRLVESTWADRGWMLVTERAGGGREIKTSFQPAAALIVICVGGHESLCFQVLVSLCSQGQTVHRVVDLWPFPAIFSVWDVVWGVSYCCLACKHCLYGVTLYFRPCFGHFCLEAVTHGRLCFLSCTVLSFL